MKVSIFQTKSHSSLELWKWLIVTVIALRGGSLGIIKGNSNMGGPLRQPKMSLLMRFTLEPVNKLTADRWKSAVGAVERLMHDPYGSSGEMTASVTNRVEITLIKISLGCAKLIKYAQKVWNAALFMVDINGLMTLTSRSVIFWTFGTHIIGLVHPRYIVIKKFFRGGLLVLDGFPPLRELFHLQQFFPMLDIELSSFL